MADKLPTEPGYYWARIKGDYIGDQGEWEIVKVVIAENIGIYVNMFSESGSFNLKLFEWGDFVAPLAS